MIAQTPTTAAELLQIADGDRYELVDGQLRERDMGAESSWVGGQVFGRLFAFNLQHPQGWVLPSDTGYQCFPDDPERVRKPDASFIRAGILPGEQLPRGHVRQAPNLVVEVVSPNDLYHEVRRKVDEYLGVGIDLLWVIDPDTRTIEVIEHGTPVAWLRCGDELTGGETLPGFSCAVADLFPPMPSVEATGA